MNIDTISTFEASIILGVPEYLVRDFADFGYNGRKLAVSSLDQQSAAPFLVSDVLEFQLHLNTPLGSTQRVAPPEHIKRYLVLEAQGICALCRQSKPNYDFAHIEPWAKSRSNSPHNLVHLCLDCHRTRGADIKLLRSLKEELLRRSSLLGDSILYSCPKELAPGDLVYALNGIVEAADASTPHSLAAGILRTKVGLNSCTVQRTGVATGLRGLVPGESYFLSPIEPGKSVPYDTFNRLRDKDQSVWLQGVGRAESSTQLAIQFRTPIGLPPD